jgi:beta-lactamase class A
MMIVMSDNSATNMAIDHLGLENINRRITKLGLKDTYLSKYKKIFRSACPRMVGDPALCEVALKTLHLQFYRTSIPRYLDGMPGATSDCEQVWSA